MILGSCSSENIDKNEKRESKIEIVETAEVTVEYPIKITHKNLKEKFIDSKRSNAEYDSLVITILSDSSYFHHYYKNGILTPRATDTLIVPVQTDTLPKINRSNASQKLVLSSAFASVGRGERLLIIEIDGKTHKVIESRGSCCDIWKPMGHMHFGSITYFSLEFGWIGSVFKRESSTNKTRWFGDWDQEMVNKLIESLPLANDELDLTVEIKNAD